MSVSPSHFAAVARLLMCWFSLIGPACPAEDNVPFLQKLEALDRLNRTGESQNCDALLAAIRKKRQEAEAAHNKYQKGIKQLEVGIANDRKLMQNAGVSPETMQSLQGTLETHLRFLDNLNRLERQAGALFEGRKREESAFAELYESVKAKRGGQEKP